ncbi:transketolase family protein [Selenomonas sp. TAMA-11512]|uniref:transketolase family protein n=1 Tax=Selenomonas sp. TAMA-11512 TaxID=3095337 RepID=UPI00308B650F|nr:transketolase family protein [Selenomonas sp. TAMA-11512]
MVGELFDPRKEFGKAVTELAATNEKIVVLSADSGKSSGFGGFIEKYPERYFECGIMEQGVVGMAAGMATTGLIPVFCAIAPFITARAFEMVRNDTGYMKQNVKLVGRNCGVTYSDLGATHQSLDDLALMSLIPGVTVLAPQDPMEIREAVKAMIEMDGPVYMRIGNPKIPQLFEDKPFVIGKADVLREGSDVTIVATGSSTMEVLEAQELLAKSGIKAEVIGSPTVVPLDVEMIKASAKKTGRVVTVEEHYVHGGLGTLVSEALSETKDAVVHRVGMPNGYAVTDSNYRELLAYYKLDGKGIAETVTELLKK